MTGKHNAFIELYVFIDDIPYIDRGHRIHGYTEYHIKNQRELHAHTYAKISIPLQYAHRTYENPERLDQFGVFDIDSRSLAIESGKIKR